MIPAGGQEQVAGCDCNRVASARCRQGEGRRHNKVIRNVSATFKRRYTRSICNQVGKSDCVSYRLIECRRATSVRNGQALCIGRRTIDLIKDDGGVGSRDACAVCEFERIVIRLSASRRDACTVKLNGTRDSKRGQGCIGANRGTQHNGLTWVNRCLGCRDDQCIGAINCASDIDAVDTRGLGQCGCGG